MFTINPEKTALTLKERITEIAAIEKLSETEVRHYSDGSELIPAEVQATMRRNGGQLPDVPRMAGYTVDDEGIVNAYTLEPAMYLATYPTPQKQRRYVFQGAIAALVVALTLVTAFSVS